MGLLISMLPFYLLGNLHCAGMCGPLVALLGKHPHRTAYFLGRISAFTLVGMCAGEVGAVLYLFLRDMHLLAATSLLFSAALFMVACGYFFSFSLPKWQFLQRFLRQISTKLSVLMLKERFAPIFCFGLATILLPCGQSLMVFSFSALTGSALDGALNGFFFAVLTTPSLWLAMNAYALIRRLSTYYRPLLGAFVLLVATLFLLRGLADLDLISHLVLSADYHIVIY